MDHLMRYFEENQVAFAKQNHGKYILIRGVESSRVVGFFETPKAAYCRAVYQDNLTSGEFLIRQCIFPEEERPAVFYSRVR